MSDSTPEDLSDPVQIEESLRQVLLSYLLKQPPETPDPVILEAFSRIYWITGRIQEALNAINLLKKVIDLEPEQLNILGFWALYLGQTQKALTSFELALRQNAPPEESKLGYAYALFYDEQYSKAAELFQQLVSQGTNFKSPAVMAKASRALAAGDKPEEIQVPPIFYLPVAMSNVLQLKLVNGPRAALAQLDSLLPTLDQEEQLPLQRLQVEILLESGLEKQALPQIKRLLKTNPSDGLLWYFKGIASHRLGKKDESDEAFYRAMLLAPMEARAWGAYAANRLEKADYQKAIATYRVALFLDDERSSYWAELAAAEGALENYDQAQKAFSKAIELGDDSFENYFNRGICFMNMDKPNSAVEDLQHALVLQPEHRRAEEARSLIAEITGESGDNDFIFGKIED